MTPREILEEASSRIMVLYHHDPALLERLLRQALGKFQDKAGVIMETWSEEPVIVCPPEFHAVAACWDNRRRRVDWRLGEKEIELPPPLPEEPGPDEAQDETDIPETEENGEEDIPEIEKSASDKAGDIGGEGAGELDEGEGEAVLEASEEPEISDALERREENASGIETIRVLAVELMPLAKHEAPYCVAWFCDLRHWELDHALPNGVEALVCDYLEALIELHNTRKAREACALMGNMDSAQALLSEQELRQRISEYESEMEACKAIVPPASMF